MLIRSWLFSVRKRDGSARGECEGDRLNVPSGSRPFFSLLSSTTRTQFTVRVNETGLSFFVEQWARSNMRWSQVCCWPSRGLGLQKLVRQPQRADMQTSRARTSHLTAVLLQSFTDRRRLRGLEGETRRIRASLPLHNRVENHLAGCRNVISCVVLWGIIWGMLQNSLHQSVPLTPASSFVFQSMPTAPIACCLSRSHPRSPRKGHGWWQPFIPATAHGGVYASYSCPPRLPHTLFVGSGLGGVTRGN